MRKRILGAAVLFSFIVSLTAASNMKEDVKDQRSSGNGGTCSRINTFCTFILRQNQMKKQESKKKKV